LILSTADVWHAPLRLRIDSAALIGNWRWLSTCGGSAACGAAIKADGYGLGAVEVARHLSAAGCRDFYVSSWGEARALGTLPAGTALAVFHGVRAEDMAVATHSAARPVLNTLAQISRWRETGRPCDVMVDTGMNRLGISVADALNGALDGLVIDTLMSHLAGADLDDASALRQLAAFRALIGQTTAKRLSLANSAGICLHGRSGADFAVDLTRPGLALYGGIPRAEAIGHITQVATPQAQILQRRTVRAGESVGYNALFTATRDTDVAIVNVGYADGYLRGFSCNGTAEAGRLPVLGRVSMDMIALGVDAAPDLGEGDWVSIDYNLPTAAAQSGLSQYELLTGLGQRFERVWV
jgi:alanine racemase